MKLDDCSQIKVLMGNAREDGAATDGEPAYATARDRIAGVPALDPIASRRSSSIAIGVAGFAISLCAMAVVYFIGKGLLASFHVQPNQSSSEGIELGFIAAMSWLGRREIFYQLLLALAVLVALFLNEKRLVELKNRLDASRQLLLTFAGFVLYFGGSATIHYWHQISLAADKFYLALGLFLTMVGGMFVQVITGNYRVGAASLFTVTTAQLIYPLLFSPIVYYAIWAVASSSSAGVFSFYAAFLNGYFWQSVVTSARRAFD
jgi:hypothetical protein